MSEKGLKDPDAERRCPRCEASFDKARGGRCQLCGLAAGARFDPTGGLEGGERYLGRIIGGHFQTLAVLAWGGHGMVLLVRHTKLEHRNIFALKLLRPELSQNEEFRHRFLREAEIVYTFSHPNIVPIREFAETEEGELFFTMDFCRGQTLDDALRGGPPFTLRRVLKIGSEILQGLAFAHRRGIIHRDLKPANVFLDETKDGEIARLLDFGIAKPAAMSELDLTAGQKVMGTPPYMAPEQILGKQLDARTDLYSFGVVLYRMVAGRPPFTGRTGHEVLAKHLRDTPASLKKIAQGVPPRLSDLVDRLLAKSRESRPPSADAVRGEMADINAAIPRPSLGSRAAQPRSFPTRTLGMALALAALAGACAYFLLASSSPSFAEPEPPSAVTPGRAAPPPRSGQPWASGDRWPPSADEFERSEASPSRNQKWCRFCRKPWLETTVTCPDCGQVLTRRQAAEERAERRREGSLEDPPEGR